MNTQTIDAIISLDNIYQWEEREKSVRESVSQHSFKVAALAALGLQELEEENLSLVGCPLWCEFKADVLSLAILHDFDEAIIGRDIPHYVKYNKYNGQKIRKEINEYVKWKAEEDKILMVSPKSPEVERFVKMFDWAALLTFLHRNRKMSGGRGWEEELVYCKMNLYEVRKEVFSLLRTSQFGDGIQNFESLKYLVESLTQ